MSEIAPERPAQLQPGSVITFADTTELHAFEDLIAPFVDPDYDAEFWATRPPLKGLVRPDDFNGPMADVRLEVMADPYACLLDSRQRGWQFNGGTASNFVRGGSSGQWQQGQYLGFIFRADAYTSGKKEPVSEIQAEIYYAPMPRSV